MRTLSLSELHLVSGGNSNRNELIKDCKNDITNGMAFGALVGTTSAKGNVLAGGVGLFSVEPLRPK
ncbi:hypothetical protein GJV52_05940 [Neisseria brasiliensis]|uniref:hypothetical protein n=1 Tax=Neisseria TaxID=482 RepID=UPI000C27331A|nr:MULTISPECIES: hypothetical protein [Neisseria]PJO79042.1 hypothetical protein CWC45_01830 [Neisseria sp. N177_16]QGL25116.1 hypothetical protein GJV52_05940 [Neisseria brasiliensis]